MHRKMKDSGVEWIGLVTEDWNTVKMKYLYSFKRGLNITRADLVKSGIPAISYGDIHTRHQFELRLNKYPLPCVDQKYIQLSPRALLSYGDFIFADTSEDVEGVGNFTHYDRNDIAFASYHTIIAQPKTSQHVRYMAYMFDSDYFRNQLRNKVSGIKVYSITQSIIKNACALLPALSVQHRIAAYLDDKVAHIDNIIDKTKKTIEEYKKYKQSLITEAVTKGLNPDVKMKDSGVEWIGEIPEHWGIIRNKYLLHEINNKSESGLEEPLSMNQKLGLIKSSDQEIPNQKTSYIGNKRVQIDDLVFNKLKAHLGVFSVSQYDGIVSPDYAVYRKTGLANVKYLEFLFKTDQCITEFKKYIKGIGAGLSRLYTTELFSIFVPFPSIEEQSKIVEILRKRISEIDTLIEKKKQLLENLESYKKFLIYEVVTGKREVY